MKPKKPQKPAPKYGDVVRDPQNQKSRMDGWQNLVTMLGTGGDKRMHSKLTWDLHPPEFYEQLYAAGSLSARIVDVVPDHALRRWVDWINVKNYEKEEIAERSLQLDLRGIFLNSWKWGRAYGGACLHIVTDTRDPGSPLRPGEKVLALRDLSRWDLRILTTDIEYDFGSTNFGHPRIYYLNLQMGSQYKGYPIHWTRMIRFDGQLVPRRTYIRNNYWHDSILNRVYNAIRNYETAHDAAAACLADFNVDVYKLNNVANLIQSGNEALVRDRVEMMAYTKSVINAMILDTKDEEYENKGRSLEGVAELLDKAANRLVADTDIPHTILLGESPDGSNATGNSTSQAWYNYLQSEQEHYAQPKLNSLVDIIFPERKNMRPKFRPLRVLDAIEEANMRKTVAETDQIYENMGALDASEITTSRFGGDEYSTDTKIDHEAREAGLIGPGSNEDLGEDDGREYDKGPTEGSGSGGEGKGGETNPKSTTGDQPPEDKKEEPSDKTTVDDKQKPAKKKADLTGKGIEARDAEEPAEEQFESGAGESEFEFRNEIHKVKNAEAKIQSFISQTMSEPMRDPKTDPQIKGPGIPNEPRGILPTRGTGVTAPSGADFQKDRGTFGEAREGLSTQEKNDSWITMHGTHVKTSESGKIESGPLKGKEYTPKGKKKPKEKEKHSKKSSGGGGGGKEGPSALELVKKASEKGAELEEGKDSDLVISPVVRAATIIVRKGDNFLMGKRRDTGRWTLPGGVVDGRESFHQGGVRELLEETGIKADKLKFLGGRVMEQELGKQVQLNIYEFAYDEDRKPTAKLDPDKELVEFRWIPYAGPLPEDIAGNLQHPNNAALDHIGLLK